MKEHKKSYLYVTLGLVFCISLIVGLVSANSPLPGYKDVYLSVANDNGARFDIYSNDTYHFFNASQSSTQGLNALHITTDPQNSPYGQVTNTSDMEGTFWFSDTGGRGWDDNGILMISVNGTTESLENLMITIISSGYQWNPVDKNDKPGINDIVYNSMAIDESFTWSDFAGSNGYTSFSKPCTGANYPLYDGQNVTLDEANENTFYSIFVDLYAGIIGLNTNYYPNLTDYGALKIQYEISGLPDGSLVAFNAYAFCNSSNQGQGIRWTNSVNIASNNSQNTTSGYYVADYFS